MTTQWHNILSSGDAAAEAQGRGGMYWLLVLVFVITKDAPLTAAHSTQNQ